MIYNPSLVAAKYKNLTNVVQKLQLQKQSHLATIRDCQKKTAYFQARLTETFAELQDVSVSVNKAKVMDCSISEKIRQAEEVSKKADVLDSALDVNLEQKPKTNKEDLLLEIQELKQAILYNTKTMEDVLQSFSTVMSEKPQFHP